MSKKVPEELARGAVDLLVSGIADDCRRSGNVTPDIRSAEDFAKQIVREVVAKEETTTTPGKPSADRTNLPPDRISRGDVGPDTVAINRPVDLNKPRPTAPEDKRLRARLDFLGKHPEWEARIIGAALDGEVMAKRMGIHDYMGRMSIVTDCVINEVDKSNFQFGDWRLPPKPKDPRIIIGAR